MSVFVTCLTLCDGVCGCAAGCDRVSRAVGPLEGIEVEEADEGLY